MSLAQTLASGAGGDGDDHLSPANFKRLAELIQEYSGIKMPTTKRTMLEGRMRRRVRSLGFADINEYCETLLDTGGPNAEMVHFIDAVTTNKTEFFREPGHFTYMRSTILPEIMQGAKRTIKLWSAAASTGAEAYTMAMVLEDCLERGWDYSILGTDLSTQVLEQAVRGVYPIEMVQPVPPDLRRRFVLQARDPNRNEARIVPRLRAKTAFARVNLMDSSYAADKAMDIIFLRNILILSLIHI